MDHDRLFKQLLRTFFGEFLELFLPEAAGYVEPGSLEFLDKEVFTDLAAGDRHEVDLLVKCRFRGRAAFFLLHVETQSYPQEDFAGRMFRYFARLTEKYGLPVYPVVLFTYDAPLRPEAETYEVKFPDLDVLAFRFRVIQLNRLNWRDFVRRPNPVAAALMAKMKIAPQDRPRVKLECLRLLVTLKLDKARQALIREFMDSYLRLSAEEMRVYDREVETIDPPEREAVMQIVNEWETRGKANLVLRLLRRKFGEVPQSLQDRVGDLPVDALEGLAEALFDFTAIADAENWITVRTQVNP